MSLPQPSTSGKGHGPGFRSPFRRRRLIWSTILLSIVVVYFFAPDSFWETSRTHADSIKQYVPERVQSAVENVNAKLPVGWGKQKYPREEELKDLLHMVASSQLVIPSDVDPSVPLEKDVYVVDLGDVAWLQEVPPDPPVIVFSKLAHAASRFSKKAKQLLGSLDLSPAPKVIEVDLRTDSDALKTILTRLTSHATFPNIFIGGVSIGGSDDLARIYEQGKLQTMLTDNGVSFGTGVNRVDSGSGGRAAPAGAEGHA